MKHFKLLALTIILPLVLTACAAMAPLPAENQPYLDAEKEVATLTSNQYLRLQDQSIYIGEITQGKATGFGKLISPDGSIYQGSVKNGKPDGIGKSTMITGEAYEGEHKEGIFEGKGILTLSDHSFFVGYFKNHKAYRGEMHFTDGKIAELK